MQQYLDFDSDSILGIHNCCSSVDVWAGVNLECGAFADEGRTKEIGLFHFELGMRLYTQHEQRHLISTRVDNPIRLLLDFPFI